MVITEWIFESGILSMAAIPFEFLFSVGVGALFFVPALPAVHEVLAQLGLVLLRLGMVLLVPELALVTLLALPLQEVAADSLAFQLKELLHFPLIADVHFGSGRAVVQDGEDDLRKIPRVALGRHSAIILSEKRQASSGITEIDK